MVDRFSTIQYKDLAGTSIVDEFVQILAQVQYDHTLIEGLDFKIVQEYYRLVKAGQAKTLEAEKKKKQKMAKLNEYFKENMALVEQIVSTVLSFDVVTRNRAYLQGLFDELSNVQDNELKRKPKQKVPIPSVDELVKKR